MSNKKENISAFIDGEASEFESASALKQLKEESSLQRCWEGYHLIGDAIRHNLSAAIPAGFSDRLMLALEQEDAHNAPRHTPYRRVNDTAGFALAASVSAVAIIGLLQFGQPAMMTAANTHYETDIQQQYNVSVMDTAPSVVHQLAEAHVESALKMDNEALAYASFDGDSVNQQVNLASSDSIEASVYGYLVNFSQYAVAAPLNGAIPTVNLASYTVY